MTNNLNLEQILEVVKEKYPKIKIEPVIETVSTIGIGMDMRGEPIPVEEPAYNHVADSIIGTPFEILYDGSLQIDGINIDNIIELKHYLDIEIKWEDLVEWTKSKGIGYRELEKDFVYRGLGFSRHGNITDVEDDKIASNRSYWQMYQIIKNLVEN